jgi:hypothetical protein
MPAGASWRRTALLCAVIAVILPVAARIVAGPRGADIHVEWQPTVDDATRQRLEERYRLDNRRKLEDTYTWRYELIDPSSDNVKAIVTEPAINDTHEIDRNTYTLEPTAPRRSRRVRFEDGDMLVGTADGVALLLLALAGLASITRGSPLRVLQRGIPEIDARTAGLFRIVFGTAVLAFFATHQVDASWLSATFDLEIEGRLHAAALDWLRDRPGLVNAATPWLLITGLAFTVGVFTRISYALFLVGVLVWSFVRVSLDSTHPLGTFLVTLVALLPSRWGDAWSVDSLLRRAAGRPDAARPPGRHYGYSAWLPGLIFGVGFAAAAWAKLTVPSTLTTWIMNGTIKYHFVTDSNLAPVDWGLKLAGHPTLAILVSSLAILTEAIVVTGAFVRSESFRLLMGAAALSVVGGFWVFMGHFWPGWWILLLGFVPWAAISRALPAAASSTAAPPSPLRPLVTAGQAALIVAVIAQQMIMSRIQIELAPMFSWYPMYSATYEGPADYDARRPPRYRIVAVTDKGTVELLRCSPHEEFVRLFQSAMKGSTEASAGVRQALGGCADDLGAVREVRLEGHKESFDWDRLQFTTQSAPTLGPLAFNVDSAQPDAR